MLSSWKRVIQLLNKELNFPLTSSLNFSFFPELTLTILVYIYLGKYFVVVHSLSHIWLFVMPWTIAIQAALSSTVSRSFLTFMPIDLVMLSNHIILCSPLILWPSIFPSIRVFSNESALHIRWSKYWSFSFSACPSNEYSGFISFRIDWFDLLAIQGTLKSIPHHHNLKASVLKPSVFFMVQLSHPYMTTGKTIVLTIWIFVGKVMSLLFNIHYAGLS